MVQLNHGGREYHLREMQLTDLPSIMEIEKKSHSHPWSETSFRSSISSSHHCFVLINQSRIAAYIITSTAADEAELLNITVAIEYRRRGLAAQLLNEVCASFNATIQTLFLEVRESNHPAISLYDSLEFNTVGQRDNYYPSKKGNGREHALIMAKTICHHNENSE